jgi:hypothetical protein
MVNLDISAPNHGIAHMAHMVNTTAEDQGMTDASLFFVGLPEYAWWMSCCAGAMLIAFSLSKVNIHEKAENMTFYQALPIAVLWSAIGITLILFNKFMFLPEGRGFAFPYAIFLMWCHSLVGTVISNILLFVRPGLMPAVRDGNFTMKTYFVNICPIACLLALSLGLGNTAYLYISVSYIQMVKNTTAAFVFIFSIMLGLEIGTKSNATAVAMVVIGLLLTTAGELDFAWLGFIFQIGATVADSLRVTLTKILMSSKHSMKFDAISNLYLVSPTTLVVLTLPMYLIDYPHLTAAVLWKMRYVLVTNALLAFGLNMTSMFFIQRCGPTTYALTGVVKDVALIGFCWLFFGHPIGREQFSGFLISLVGFHLYNHLKSDPDYLEKAWHHLQGKKYIADADKGLEETKPLIGSKV